jgi:oxygen-independent coproporphyrinogen-3 oxidase
MRNFRLAGATSVITEYSCQDDGMVGLGCGARSYTRDLHYSFDYAVSVRGVRAVLDDYLARPASDFAFAEVGFTLDDTEQRRRWLLKSLLRAEGASIGAWRERFGDAMPPLDELHERGWLVEDGERIRLTDEGLAHADLIGPWLVSGPVRAAMQEYQLQ